ncbi:cytochrome P450 [Fomes fomentarius]|nr:cytochrome P450 [Fomes fomentarius]
MDLYPSLWYLTIAAVFVILLHRTQSFRCRSNGLPLPPGPRPLPIIGNTLDIPSTSMAAKFRDISATYGDIIYLSAFGRPMIVLGSHEAAIDLLGKRSVNYSSRPHNPMLDMAGISWALTLQPLEPIHQYFNPNAIHRYELSMELEAHRLTGRLLEHPADFLSPLDEERIDYLKIAEHSLVTFLILRHVPDWMPGAAFKPQHGRGPIADFIWYRIVSKGKRIATEGIAEPSMAAGLMENASRTQTRRKATLSTVESFFLAMDSYPELEAVFGPYRLPEFSDRNSLPSRWRSVVPVGVPHCSLEDDEYRGYFIKGSVVIANIWAISNDPKIYADPEMVKPERFLTQDGQLRSDVRDPATISFGYGRRICPGRHFADSALFIVFERLVKLSGKMTHGLLSYPEPFECTIKPLSPEAEVLIRASLQS